MKESFWGYFIIIAGIVGLAIALLFQDITNTNEQNYYLVKEITEASMLESVSIAYYERTGNIKINKEKFIENFIRRYAESAGFNKNYNINFYDINEEPPKVSLSVGSKSNMFSFTGDEFDIINRIDGILETKYSE